MKTALMIAIIVLSTSGGDVLIARGIRQIGEISTMSLIEWFQIARRIFRNSSFLAGLLLMAVSFFAFMAVLSWADLSLVVPATSVSYAISTVGAKLILRERVNRLRWLGTLLVGLGVALVSFP
jgi:drug/metabolite transporter (DMT)-like permease